MTVVSGWAQNGARYGRGLAVGPDRQRESAGEARQGRTRGHWRAGPRSRARVEAGVGYRFGTGWWVWARLARESRAGPEAGDPCMDGRLIYGPLVLVWTRRGYGIWAEQGVDGPTEEVSTWAGSSPFLFFFHFHFHFKIPSSNGNFSFSFKSRCNNKNIQHDAQKY